MTAPTVGHKIYLEKEHAVNSKSFSNSSQVILNHYYFKVTNSWQYQSFP